MSIFNHYQNRYEATKEEEYSLQEFLLLCKEDSNAYASAAERLLLAIGEPEVIDTATDPRLSRIFSNRLINR
ncbi:MAG: PrkA family serine protein kinase, partial [Gammaproteobacteria bacterium]|nr:PrkA family serine protein kinase [Gammaproteobacteria bacterium]